MDILSDDGATPLVVSLTTVKIKRILGMEVDLNQVQEVLGSLGFTWECLGEARLDVTVPYWRNDVNIEEDLVEEVVRTIGYDSVPTTMLSSPIPFQQSVPVMGIRDRIKDLLVSAGVQEVINYPLTCRKNESMCLVCWLDFAMRRRGWRTKIRLTSMMLKA